MTAGPRSHDVDPPQRAQFLARDVDFVQANPSLGQRDAGRNRSPQRVRLLKNLSNQMMRKFARLSHCSCPLDRLFNSSQFPVLSSQRNR